uniref:vitamin-K-epoxide reductase (warfarin-sensitive) n=1 Tax=Clastoptera arizonana TaxID=38151 RepID=A0A1B6EAE4_9HEMI
MLTIQNINVAIRLSSILGIILSIYAYIVEISKEHDEKYIALCDISEHMSCSKVFTSVYGRGFGILHHIVGLESTLNQPNSLLGIIFYSFVILLTFSNSVSASKILIFLGILSNIGSVYLASILYFILYDFCVVCVSTYVVNATNLILSLFKLKTLAVEEKRKSN